MKKIRYVGARPSVVDGAYMYDGDVREVGDKKAAALAGKAGIFIVPTALEVAEIPVEAADEILEELPVEFAQVEPVKPRKKRGEK